MYTTKQYTVTKILDYFNQVNGTRYKTNTKSNRQAISARLEENFTFEDFVTVIEYIHDKWSNDPKMSKYNRPSTIFRPSKFESYLMEAEKQKQKNKKLYDELGGWL